MMEETEPRQPAFNIPCVIRIVAIITILVHFLQLFSSPAQHNELIRYLAFIPARFSLSNVWELEGFSLALSTISYAFLHADGYHLILNIFFLLAFGTAAARRVSWPVFLILYATGAVISAFSWMALNSRLVGSPIRYRRSTSENVDFAQATIRSTLPNHACKDSYIIWPVLDWYEFLFHANRAFRFLWYRQCSLGSSHWRLPFRIYRRSPYRRRRPKYSYRATAALAVKLTCHKSVRNKKWMLLTL